MNEHQTLAIRALRNMEGDDLERARIAFRGRTPQQMEEQYDQSGMTCTQILAEYEQQKARIKAAIAWFEEQ